MNRRYENSGIVLLYNLILAIGCSESQQAGNTHQQSERNLKKERSTRPAEIAVLKANPAEPLSYTIEESHTGGFSRKVTVLTARLNRKATESELRQLSRSIKDKHDNLGRIFFKLPGMADDWGAWARSDFDPELEIVILGLSTTDDEVIDLADSTIPGEILGRWANETVGNGAYFTLFRNEGKTYFRWTLKGGGGTTFEVVERPSAAGRRYEEIEPQHGEYFLLDATGTLKRGESRGIYLTLPPIKRGFKRESDAASSLVARGGNPTTSIQSTERAATEKIVVLFSLECKVQADRSVIVAGKTNLPPQTALFIRVSDAIWDEYHGSTAAEVLADGSFQSGTIGPLEVGLYVAQVSLAREQPKQVKQIIGHKAENLSGPLVKKPANRAFADISDLNIEAEANLQVGGKNATAIQVARLTMKLVEYKKYVPQIEDLYSRLEVIKTQQLVPNSNYMAMRPGSVSNVFWADVHSLIDEVNDSPIGKSLAGNYARYSLADIMTMWMNIDDAQEYKSAQAEFQRDFKELKNFIRDREGKLVKSNNDLASSPTHVGTNVDIRSENMNRTSGGGENFRSWTSAKGQYSVEARIVRFANSKVTLERRDGNTIDVDIERLSETDRDFIEQWRSQNR